MESDNKIREYNHTFNMVERKNVKISGVKKVDSFDNEEFLIDSVMGYIILKGKDLELIKLDTHDGIANIKGIINSLNYVDDVKKQDKENSILNRLFK